MSDERQRDELQQRVQALEAEVKILRRALLLVADIAVSMSNAVVNRPNSQKEINDVRATLKSLAVVAMQARPVGELEDDDDVT
ncbi:hypothetical protein [Pseudooceanicola sp.]|uniref:hypothetical protein n=1 Tax=Pseudooceanicola sp. TaxID=1914328 RepID=UPI003516F053